MSNLNTKFDNDGIEESNQEHPINVLDEIERGINLYKDRQLAKKPVNFEPLYKKNTKETTKIKQPVTIYKKYCISIEEIKHTCKEQKCRHYGNVIINRDIMTPKEYVNFLSRPKYTVNHNYSSYKNNYCETNQKCYYVKSYPSPATTRIEELSIPAKKHIINTWLQYGNIISARQISNLANKLFTSKYTTIEKALDNINEDKKLQKRRKLKLLKETARIKKKIQLLRTEHIKEILCSVSEVLKDFLMNECEPQDLQLTGTLQPLTNAILKHIVNILDVNIPSPQSENFVDKFLISVSRNVAHLIGGFLKDSGFQLFSEQLKKDSCSCLYEMDKNTGYEQKTFLEAECETIPDEFEYEIVDENKDKEEIEKILTSMENEDDEELEENIKDDEELTENIKDDEELTENIKGDAESVKDIKDDEEIAENVEDELNEKFEKN